MRMPVVWVFVSIAFGICGTRMKAEETIPHEYNVKAAYLFNFAKFIDWPTNAFPTPDSPFVIGVLENGEAMGELSAVLTGKQINGRPVKLIPIPPEKIPKDLQILFVTRAAEKSPDELQKAMRGTSTLLVGETDQFSEKGGMVGFVREKDAVRFTLNLERTVQAGLKVSARLSSVAKVVSCNKYK